MSFVRNNRAVRAFRPCRRNGQDARYRQRFCHYTITGIIRIPYVSFVDYTNGNTLGRIDNAAATHGQNKINAFFFAKFHPFQRQFITRVGLYAAQFHKFDAGSF